MRKVNLFLIVCLIFACGCEKKLKPEDKVVAKINAYEMTVSDFKNEARLVWKNKSLPADPGERKRALLKELIDKKILILEAQKANFDKEKAFMKEIERYWEQALLKLLFERKAEELVQKVSVDENSLLNEYNKHKKNIFAEIVILRDKTAAEQLSNDAVAFEKAEKDFSEWYAVGDLPEDLENGLFALSPGQICPAVKSADTWVVMRAVKEEVIDVGSFEKLKPQLAAELVERKRARALDEWTENLKNDAKVTIYDDVLKGIDLEQEE